MNGMFYIYGCYALAAAVLGLAGLYHGWLASKLARRLYSIKHGKTGP